MQSFLQGYIIQFNSNLIKKLLFKNSPSRRKIIVIAKIRNQPKTTQTTQKPPKLAKNHLNHPKIKANQPNHPQKEKTNSKKNICFFYYSEKWSGNVITVTTLSLLFYFSQLSSLFTQCQYDFISKMTTACDEFVSEYSVPRIITQYQGLSLRTSAMDYPDFYFLLD